MFFFEGFAFLGLSIGSSCVCGPLVFLMLLLSLLAREKDLDLEILNLS